MELLINRIKGLDNESQVIETELLAIVDLMEVIRLKIIELKKISVEENKDKLTELLSEYRGASFRVQNYEATYYGNLALINELVTLLSLSGENPDEVSKNHLSEKTAERLKQLKSSLTPPITVDLSTKTVKLREEQKFLEMEAIFKKGMKDEDILRHLNDPRFAG